MAQTRASARTRGKSDPIDALAVARAFLREPDFPRLVTIVSKPLISAPEPDGLIEHL
jgi:hypothetical protein